MVWTCRRVKMCCTQAPGVSPVFDHYYCLYKAVYHLGRSAKQRPIASHPRRATPKRRLLIFIQAHTNLALDPKWRLHVAARPRLPPLGCLQPPQLLLCALTPIPGFHGHGQVSPSYPSNTPTRANEGDPWTLLQALPTKANIEALILWVENAHRRDLQGVQTEVQALADRLTVGETAALEEQVTELETSRNS